MSSFQDDEVYWVLDKPHHAGVVLLRRMSQAGRVLFGNVERGRSVLHGDQPVGPVSAARYGSAGILPIPWVYLKLMGAEGLRPVEEHLGLYGMTQVVVAVALVLVLIWRPKGLFGLDEPLITTR